MPPPLSFLRVCALTTALVGPAFAEPVGMFPLSSPPARNLYALDLKGASTDDVLTAATLQGIVNRGEKSVLYLLVAHWDEKWLEHLKKAGHIESSRSITLHEALTLFRNRIKCLLQYDPDLPASINIATMMASLRGGIVVAPDAFGEPLAGIPRECLAGRWPSNVAAYRWALENLFPHMNQRVLACYHPTACRHHLRDYLVRHKIFHFWVTSPPLSDGLIACYEQERALVVDLLRQTPDTIPVLGFWYSGADSGLNEYVGVGLAGEYGKITVPSDWGTNFSLLSGISIDWKEVVTAYRARLLRSPPPIEEDKVYIAYNIIESGDAPSYLQSRQWEVWKDPMRGKIPINWTVGPGIMELAPSIFAYFLERATPADYFFPGLSGAGYCHPFRDFMTRVDDSERAWARYLELTGHYMKKLQCNELALYTDAWRPYDRNQNDPVVRRFIEGIPALQGIVLGMGRDEAVSPEASNYFINGTQPVLVSHIMTRWPVDYASRTREENIAWLLEDIQAHTPKTRPAFLQVMALSWAFGPSEILEVHQRLGPEYVPLTLPQFNALYRLSQSHN